ncbi:hypothetical protein SAMN05660964_00982 [Thiothrix caldifontis]|uniref:PD-(D/E)XK nuclease superfamily protein n=1 Tax=Thiothrix caldifontis TaxID=525918 RepID=A0A1H3YMP4_9GAMM|nr:hypothetical protein [Thiothrix caldifontis]SEA12889.1 hypothetical protein SAMN05660964_00982 [Thiothrix caldifontis]
MEKHIYKTFYLWLIFFLRYRDDVNGDFFGAELTVGNTVLRNSRLVGGADFDCIFKCKGKLILTDVKTTIKPLKLEYLRQIIGYALLYNEDLDSFKFTDIGIYHSRSGSFRYLSLDGVVKKALPSLNSIVQARQEFIGFIEKDRLKKLEELKKVQAEQEALRAIELAKKESLKEKRKIARLAKAEAIKNGTYEIGEQKLIRLKKAEEKRKIEIIKQERKLASNEKRKIARLAKAEVIKNGTYEIGEQELILAKEKLRVMEQERALAK